MFHKPENCRLTGKLKNNGRMRSGCPIVNGNKPELRFKSFVRMEELSGMKCFPRLEIR